jgi:multidrug transporter EmrE-like cation transporter
MSLLNISLLSLSEIFGDFALEKFAHTGAVSALSAGLIGYIAVIIFLIRSMTRSTILKVNVLWDGLSALIESAAAVFILGETFDDPKQWLGAGLIVSGLFLLKFSRDN